MPDGARATFYVRYWSGGSSGLSFSIESKVSFDAFLARTTAKNFIYYGMMLILIVIASFAFMATRRNVFLAYAGYSGSALLFIMHADGNGFKFLWPDSPQFNGFASIAWGSGIIVFGAVYAMLFLETRRYHRVIDKLLAGVILLAIGMLAASAFLDNQPIKKMLVLVAFAAILLFAVSGLAAARHRFKQVRFYVIAWTGAVVSSAIMAGRHWLGIDISEEVQFDSMRIVMVSDAALMGLAIWDYFNQLRQGRQAALQANLTKTTHNLELSRRLQDLEEQYAIARDLADQKGRQIADTIHDLSQPLHALRLDLRKLASNPSIGPQSQARIEDTFTYLETLVADHLESAIARAPRSDTYRETAGAEQLSVGEILRGIHEMFAADAQEKGLEFRYVGTSLQAQIKPFVLMRIVTNLVSNAIKYTDKGRVLLGCRRQGDALRIEVHDTGPGMTHEDFAKARLRAVRLDRDSATAEGHGLGLSIACSLAKDHGLALNIAPARRNGIGFILAVPRADGA
jgi:signal transduction histidine kinase